MQSEITTALNVFDSDYQLGYSESYSGTVHQETAIEGYQNGTPLRRAFELLISENYTKFIILTVRCIAVVIVIWGSKYLVLMLEICMVKGNIKVTSSTSRYELPSLDSLVHYFQTIHNIDISKVRVQIENFQNGMVSQNNVNETSNFNLSCVVALRSLCYSVMKPCNYWNYNSTLLTIVDSRKKMCGKSSLEHNQQLSSDFPPKVVIVCGIEVNLDNLFESEGILTDSLLAVY